MTTPDPTPAERACGLCRRYGHGDDASPSNPVNWPGIPTPPAVPDTGDVDALAEHWRVFRHHVPVGAYFPIGQLDGDCRHCGEAWPCARVREVLTPLITVRQDTVEQVLSDLQARLCRAANSLDEVQAAHTLESERNRLRGKAEGVRLALSYADEAAREAGTR